MALALLRTMQWISTFSSRLSLAVGRRSFTRNMLDAVVSPPKLIDKPQSTEKQILKIFYKDNTFKSYNLPVEVQAADVCTKFATKFLRISERAASHFSLQLVIQGKGKQNILLKILCIITHSHCPTVVKQLKHTDRPIKIQKELSTLGYKFNTNENDNYFLFCLSEETKSKMNDYCERNSVMLPRGGAPKLDVR